MFGVELASGFGDGICVQWENKMKLTDPVECIIQEALDEAGIVYLTGDGGENPAGLDFYLPAYALHIEVKRLHSDRIAEQMSRVQNVIAVQGIHAAQVLADFIRRGRPIEE
jgi:hypothetical protein